MDSPVDQQLSEEVRRFRLRFACPDCAHFEEEAQACSNGYPNQAHLEPNLLGRRLLTFCKSFELY